MTRAGVDIREYPLKDAVDPGIGYNMAYAEMDACVSANLDPWRWECGEYSQSFKAKVVAWSNMHKLIGSHVEDAVARKAARKGKHG